MSRVNEEKFRLRESKIKGEQERHTWDFSDRCWSHSTNTVDKRKDKVNWKQLAGRMQNDRISEIR